MPTRRETSRLVPATEREQGRDGETSASRRPLGPRELVVIISLIGVCITGLSAWSAHRVDSKSEERLLEVQTRQAASVLSAAIFVIEQPLSSALTSQEVLGPDGDRSALVKSMTPSLGAEKAFVSASLWRSRSGTYQRLAATGVRQGMSRGGPEIQRFLDRARSSRTFVVSSVKVGNQSRIAYALAGPKTGLVLYAERVIPSNRRAPVDQDSAYKDLNYAIYLGRSTDAAALSTTDVDPADLPLEGTTYRTTVPFGDTVLTLVTSPRRHLGATLSELFPLIVLLGGLLLTVVASIVARTLAAARVRSEGNVGTISALYARVNSLYEEQRGLSLRLQRALLPQSSPVVPGFTFASDYIAGAAGVDIGGDWYSAIQVGDEEFAFVVGDVSGRGVDAVAVMARARFTLRAYLLDGSDPATALEKCSHQFDISTDGHIITAVVGLANWRTGHVTVANAGHPLPLLITEDLAEYVPVPVGPPLGIGSTRYTSTSFVLPEGSTLLAFTDGLIERRTEGIDVGMDRLAGVAAPLARVPVSDLVASVVSSLRLADGVDDVAVLALRREDAIQTDLVGDAAAPAKARAFISQHLLAGAKAPDVPTEDVVLTVSELVTNAVRAGATSIGLALHRGDDRLMIVVTDDAPGWPTPKDAAIEDSNGRGLAIVQRLADDFAATVRPPGKSVTAVWFTDRDHMNLDSRPDRRDVGHEAIAVRDA
jgi:serine phosphatase RsbU (regulator of sigma subunit)/anti-sigma regulatory factor (Ser/Thr protein kinase)